MYHMVLVALGGAIGSVLRYLTGMAALRLMGPNFPWGTLTVNIVGSFAIGLLSHVVMVRFGASDALRLLLITGVLGGFTTFSAFTLDAIVLAERGALVMPLVYVAASVILSIGAAVLGLGLARSFG
ncbi:fluoride efflux transporter CrcB [Rhizobium sp. CECT 9324]|jgi:CrcB protein|uniref:fluoride efflux transporter CrcB n=1 Tax=Rhizobium sp. CECT 9324 TaxID=2845820 RepID=UPI000DDEEF7D|nr:fluoride efflux transporter CrcB [Rhizobium sp. CECT 9324]CAH0341040.1 Putative fluoride ion transporter CrcB [Rhizobium sp. CECT 9324]